jgi:hypothetical protein
VSGVLGDRIAQVVAQRMQTLLGEMVPSQRQAEPQPASERDVRSEASRTGRTGAPRTGSPRSAAPVRRGDGQRERAVPIASIPTPVSEGSVAQARDAERDARGARRDAIRDGAYRIGGVRRSSGRQAVLAALRTPTAAQTAVVVSELLGPPRSMRPYPG